MRRIAIINQKGGVGKTTTAVNLGAALARSGQRVVVIDMDPQANASLHLGEELAPEEPSTYSVMTAGTPLEGALRQTATPGLSILPSHIDLSGAELELASAFGRETILRDALDAWETTARANGGEDPADCVLIDCPPSLGLLSVNGLAAAREVLIVLQTEFFALQGLSKLIEVIQLLQRRMNPSLEITGVLACLYDGRLRLAREVLAEIRRHFSGQVYRTAIRCNIKLAEAPSHGRTIFEYDPSSAGARDYEQLAAEYLAREGVVVPGSEAEPEPEPESGVVVERAPAAGEAAQEARGDAAALDPPEEGPALEEPPLPEAEIPRPAPPDLEEPGEVAAQIHPQPAPEEPAPSPPPPPPEPREMPAPNLSGRCGEERVHMPSPLGPLTGRQ